MNNDGAAPFYKEGLRFSCKACSACCRHEAGFVFLTEDDLSALTRAKGAAPEEFIAMYCRWVFWQDADSAAFVERLCLRETTAFDCIFWKDGCAVYEARPLQCRAYPFWTEILETESSWRQNAASCPGADSGAFHTCREIEDIAAQYKAARPIQRSQVSHF